VGDQSSYLSRQLERRIGGTGRRRKDPHIVARIGPWELGFAERSWRLGFQNSCGRRQGWWHGCAVDDRRRMHALRESKPVFRRKRDAPQVSGYFQFHRHLKELADGPRSLDPGHAAPHRSRWLSGFRARNFQLHPHIPSHVTLRLAAATVAVADERRTALDKRAPHCVHTGYDESI